MAKIIAMGRGWGEKVMFGCRVGKKGKEGWGKFGSFIPFHFPQSFSVFLTT